MAGFFTNEQIPTSSSINAPTCAKCGLAGRCHTPKMKPSGKGKKGLYLLGERPTIEDDKKGKHFTGESGKYLRSVLRSKSISLPDDCISDYALSCKPLSGKKTTTTQIQACRSSTLDAIREHKPKVIVAFDNDALNCLLAHRWTKNLGGVSKWRGFIVPDRELQAWVLFTHSLSFVLKERKKNPVINKIFRDDMALAIKHLKKPLPTFDDERKCVKILPSEEEQIDWMRTLLDTANKRDVLLAFDYETTGLKYQADGHAIACVGMSYQYNEAVAFMFPLGTNAARWFKRVLQHSRVQKTAHNMKYEQGWTKGLMGYDVQPWLWCSMQGAHVLDNRPGISGLKFQTYIHFGMMGYDDVVAPYLKGTEEKNANSLNTVFKAPRAELLLYCGIDALVQYRLALKQLQEIGYGQNITAVN